MVSNGTLNRVGVDIFTSCINITISSIAIRHKNGNNSYLRICSIRLADDRLIVDLHLMLCSAFGRDKAIIYVVYRKFNKEQIRGIIAVEFAVLIHAVGAKIASRAADGAVDVRDVFVVARAGTEVVHEPLREDRPPRGRISVACPRSVCNGATKVSNFNVCLAFVLQKVPEILQFRLRGFPNSKNCC